jgi:hypothetical protein
MSARFSYLLSSGNNPKTIKSDLWGVYITAIMNLFPGAPNVCPWATVDCILSCLHSAGNPAYQSGKDRARMARTKLFFDDRPAFIRRLFADTEQHVIKAERLGVKPAVRLNGTSDLQWEVIAPEWFAAFPNVMAYDYTKGAHRLTADWRSRKMPSNYDLTLSYSGHNWAKCETALHDGGRVAMVFGGVSRTKPLPSEYLGFPVHDGDITDLTFTRPAGILGLRAKGLARKAYKSPFVVWNHSTVDRESWADYRYACGIG